VVLENQPLERGALHYLGTNRDELDLKGSAGSRILLIGGEPFTEGIGASFRSAVSTGCR
jgi:hypothetical protein